MNNGAQIAACKLSEVRAKPSTTSLSRPLSDSSMRDSRRESIQKRAIDGEWSVRVGRCAEVGTKLGWPLLIAALCVVLTLEHRLSGTVASLSSKQRPLWAVISFPLISTQSACYR